MKLRSRFGAVILASAIALTLTARGHAAFTEDEIKAMAEDAKTHLQGSGFEFSYPDLEGETVTLADERFKGKVTLIDIWGTWCRPCRKEAPFLVELYERHREEGLEIVGIAYETSEDAEENLERVRKFTSETGAEYTLLYGGRTKETREELPLPVARLGFPTVIILDREGRVQMVEAGFWTDTAETISSKVKELLNEKVPPVSKTSTSPSADR